MTDDLPVIPSPPIVPDLTPEQSRFLALHRQYFVERWQWLFGGGTLRAEAGRCVAAITCAGFAALVDLGLIEPVGCAGVRLTEAGKAVAL